MIGGKDFDVLKKKSKDYYKLIKNSKAKLPNNSQHLRKTFNLSEDHLKKVFWLPNKVSFEPYIKPFKYKVLNSILFTNKKLPYLPVYKSTFYSLKICQKNRPRLIHGSKTEIKKSSGRISIIIVSYGNKHPLLHGTSYDVFSLINLSS